MQWKTFNAVQRNWFVPSEFPCCPKHDNDTILTYAENLKIGAVFCRNHVYSNLVSKYAISEDRQSLYVITEAEAKDDAVKRWALAVITRDDGMFVQTSVRTFFTEQGGKSSIV